MKIIITMGDSNGIGIETCFKSIARFDKEYSGSDKIELEIAGNTQTIKEYLSLCGKEYSFKHNFVKINNRNCVIRDCSDYSQIEFGKISSEAGKAAAQAIEYSIEELISQRADATVTMPISKKAINEAGWKFPGHTEIYAKRTGVKTPLMILFSENIRVALATIHIPIKEIPYELNSQLIIKLGNKFAESLKSDFGINSPKIAVLGLNPHAGESGKIGSEEIEYIIPAIDKLRLKDLSIDGPFPADGFFARGTYKHYDGIFAMYHDQGLIPLKMLAGMGGVNYTAGLPIVRTSPDHGTAFEIAGKWTADEQSSFESIVAAVQIVENRKKYEKADLKI